MFNGHNFRIYVIQRWSLGYRDSLLLSLLRQLIEITILKKNAKQQHKTIIPTILSDSY